jgi:hypothetical protein
MRGWCLESDIASVQMVIRDQPPRICELESLFQPQKQSVQLAGQEGSNLFSDISH